MKKACLAIAAVVLLAMAVNGCAHGGHGLGHYPPGQLKKGRF